MSAPNKYSANSIKAQVIYDATLLDGSDFFTDTTAHTGRWCAIAAVAAAVATVVDDLSGTFTSIPIPAGMTIYGKFSSITLASGKVLAYK